jgi:hypothetical protein
MHIRTVAETGTSNLGELTPRAVFSVDLDENTQPQPTCDQTIGRVAKT